jgi:hypothetical protein
MKPSLGVRAWPAGSVLQPVAQSTHADIFGEEWV